MFDRIMLRSFVFLLGFFFLAAEAQWQTNGLLNSEGRYSGCVVLGKFGQNSFVRVVLSSKNEVIQLTVDPGPSIVQPDRLTGLKFDDKIYSN